MFVRRWILVTLVALICIPGVVLGQDVLPGFDILEHQPPSDWDFGSNPLPADFFGPGSDPFDGVIALKGDPLGSSPFCPGDLNLADMIVQRKDPATLPGIPSSDIIDIEIVEMSLVSVAPIIVSYNGGSTTEEWDVEITLSASVASTGTMTITKEHADGGTFDETVVFQPYFTFTRVSDMTVRTLDGASIYDETLEAQDVPWVYAAPPLECPPCASNFIPGHNGTQKVPFVLSGIQSTQTVMCACTISTPTLTQWGVIAIAALLLAAGAFVISRRRRAAVARAS